MPAEPATIAESCEQAGPTLRSVTLRLGALYWTASFITDSIVWGVAGAHPVNTALWRLVICLLGAGASFGLSAMLVRLRHWSLRAKALFCFAVALGLSPFFAMIDYAIAYIYFWPMTPPIIWADVGRTMVSFNASFFGWCCLFVALQYSFAIREQEQRLAATREEALAAQMRALRYQINPHFLFNTLNSIAALIGEGQPQRAERMVLSLSEFLHETLRRDPTHDLRLDEELSLQLAYLGIERERFPDRVVLRIDVPDDIRDLMVPSLILQPLIENAVKHGVNAALGVTAINIRAWRGMGGLTIQVENDVPRAMTGTSAAPGFGIGLRNVAQRIQARFDAAGTFMAGLTDEGRFCVSLTIPAQPA